MTDKIELPQVREYFPKIVAEILSSIFPGVRQMTEEESEEYEAFLDAYFD